MCSWQPLMVPYMAVQSMNQSCRSIIYMITSGAQRTMSTTMLGSLPSSASGYQSERSSAHSSRVGCTSGAIWKLYENQNLSASNETQKSKGILAENEVDGLADEDGVGRLEEADGLERPRHSAPRRGWGRSGRASRADRHGERRA